MLQNLRGGVSYIGKRFQDFDSSLETEKESIKCFYSDVNNLCKFLDIVFKIIIFYILSFVIISDGSIMTEALPTHEYEWMTEEELSNLNLDNYDLDGDVGMVLECEEISYPEELHQKHQEFPMIAARRVINFSDLSPISKQCHSEVFPEKNQRHKNEKLCTDFTKKKNYVAHAKNIKFYLKHGIKISKFKKGVKFKQSKFLQNFINLCTSLRAKAKTKFEKDLFKLMANSAFGKFIENSRLYLQINLASNQEELNKYCLQPFFENTQFISPTLVAAISKPAKIPMDKPYAIGFR